MFYQTVHGSLERALERALTEVNKREIFQDFVVYVGKPVLTLDHLFAK